MALSTQDRLEAELGVQPDDLGLTEAAYTERLAAWEALADDTQPDPTKRYSTVKTYLLRTWITNLTREVEKFRAEGKITVEQNVMARIALLRDDLLIAQSATVTVDVADTASFGPIIDGWGVG